MGLLSSKEASYYASPNDVHAALFFVHKSNVAMLTFPFMPMLIL